MIESRFTNTVWFWWLTSLVLGMVASWGSNRVALGAGHGWVLLLNAIGLFVAASVVGYLRPERPWRWSIPCVLGTVLTSLTSLDELTRLSLWVLLVYQPYQINNWAPALGGAYLSSMVKRRSTKTKEGPKDPTPRRPVFRGNWPFWPLVWGFVLSSATLFVGVFGGLMMYPESNLAPIMGFLIAPLGLTIGLAGGALVSLIRRWTNWQMALLLAGSAVLCALALLHFMDTLR